MNLESFEILQYFPWFGTLDEYRAVIFSVFTEENSDAVIVHGREDEVGFLISSVEKQLQKNFDAMNEQQEFIDGLDNVIK